MAITDLTGTKWKFNSTITTNLSKWYNVNVVCSAVAPDGTPLEVTGQIGGNAGTYFGVAPTVWGSPMLYFNVDYRYTSDTEGTIEYSNLQPFELFFNEGADNGDASLINWLQANATQVSTTPRLSVDVSTLAGWANLSAGEKNITIVAKAAGYKDSAPSAAVQVTNAAAMKTLKAGTYKWKDNVTLIDIDQAIEFTSNNTQYAIIKSNEGRAVITYTASYSDAVYINGAWTNEAYKTIILATDQQVSADFYEWAITGGNLVAQPTGETWLLDENLTLSDSNGFTGIDFISNSIEYDYIGWYTDSETNNITMYYLRKSDNYQQKVYVRARTPGSPAGWINGEAYRTLAFITAPSGDLLTWLQSNATKQS